VNWNLRIKKSTETKESEQRTRTVVVRAISRHRFDELMVKLATSIRSNVDCGLRSVVKRVLTDNLGSKYGVTPVHSLWEIEMLHGRFPQNIQLYQAVRGGEVLGGIVLYVTPQVVHAQYSSATPEGKRVGVIDLLYDQIIHRDYAGYPYFDFGRSTEHPDGSGLNEQLVFQKEGFGGRGLCYDIYQYDL